MRKYGLAFVLLITCISCSEEAQNESDFVAGELFTDSNIRVILIDTLSIEASSFKFDSIVTSSATRALVGKYSDSIFGEVNTSSFFELAPIEYTIDSEAVYDSIVLHLKLDGYYYNDTLQKNNIHVKRLEKELKLEHGDLYNTSTIDYYEEDLGVLSYYPRPLEADTLQIKLSDTFGTAIFKKLQSKDLSNFDEFKSYFKGISLQAGDTDNGAVIGFSIQAGASFIRLYHSIAEADDIDENYTDFQMNASDASLSFFNSLVTTDPQASIQALTNREFNQPSTASNNRSFIQCGIGICTRLQFPSIKNLYDLKGEGTILDAVLKIRPAKSSYDQHLILRDSLQVFVVDQNNDLTSQLSGVHGILNTANQEFNDIYYEIPMGAYIEKLLLTEQDTDEAIILFPSNYNSTVDRFVLGGNADSEYDAILEVTYAIYDQD